MKVYISADMEGVCGITHPLQCRPSHPDYARFRRLFTEEVNAAVASALQGGITEVVVNDSHLNMTNLLIEHLHPAASLISGTNKDLCQLEGLDESFAGVFFVGYHEGDGDGDGVVNHTLMSATIRRVRLNDVAVSEATLNAHVAASFGVPVALVTGDDRICASATAGFPGVEVVTVKRAIDRVAAESRSVADARAQITQGAAAAAEKLSRRELTVRDLDGPVTIAVEFRSTSSAHMCALFPGVDRISPTEITFQHASVVDAYRHFWGLSIVAAATQNGVVTA
jgi:D-amino peptidase